MAQELVYTSVPRGLEPGRTGFCTVAMTRGMSPFLVKQLEGLVAYTPVFMHYDVNSSCNPPSIFHYPISDGRTNYELLARVSTCGLDYTKRSNKIGHFILLSPEERKKLSEGPSCLFSDQLFMTEWNGEPQYFPVERNLNCVDIAFKKAVAWEEATGDAGWASWLAEWYLAEPDKPCFVIFDPLRHLNLQALVSESLMLLPKNRRWDVTWNTYLTALPAGLSCNWRFCTGNPDILRNIGYQNNAHILDLRQSLGMAGNTPLSQSARMGTNPIPNVKKTAPTMAASAGLAPSKQDEDGMSLNAMIRKRQQEEEKRAAKEAEEVSQLSIAPLRLGNNSMQVADGAASAGDNSGYVVNGNPYLSNHTMVHGGMDMPISSIGKKDAKWNWLLLLMSGIIFIQFVIIVVLLLSYVLPQRQKKSGETAEGRIVDEQQQVVSESDGPDMPFLNKNDNDKMNGDNEKIADEKAGQSAASLPPPVTASDESERTMSTVGKNENDEKPKDKAEENGAGQAGQEAISSSTLTEISIGLENTKALGGKDENDDKMKDISEDNADGKNKPPVNNDNNHENVQEAEDIFKEIVDKTIKMDKTKGKPENANGKAEQSAEPFFKLK